MNAYQVEPIFDRINPETLLKVTVPGSKSMTNRALLLAALAQGESRLEGVLFSEDSRALLDCMQVLGFPMQVREGKAEVAVTGKGGVIPRRGASINVQSAGTAARFLTALLGVSDGSWHLDSSDQMKNRPMGPLLSALRMLGTEIICSEREGHFPYQLTGNPQPAQEVSVNIDNSSQFLSGLLIAFGALGDARRIHTEGDHGMAYIDMTLKMMHQFGVKVKKDGGDYIFRGGEHYQPCVYQIEPDVSAACYFYAMAPLLGIPVQVRHIHFDSMQGDVQFLKILEQMGCTVSDEADGILVKGPKGGCFDGVDADMHACSDQAITLAAIAPFAKTPTTIRGIGHIRLQESDRIKAIVTELTAMGIRCEDLGDELRIYPGTPAAHSIHTYGDHRMAMGFSLIGLRVPGIAIEDPDCCRKTFEEYFMMLDRVVKGLTSGQACAEVLPEIVG